MACERQRCQSLGSLLNCNHKAMLCKGKKNQNSKMFKFWRPCYNRQCLSVRGNQRNILFSGKKIGVDWNKGDRTPPPPLWHPGSQYSPISSRPCQWLPMAKPQIPAWGILLTTGCWPVLRLQLVDKYSSLLEPYIGDASVVLHTDSQKSFVGVSPGAHSSHLLIRLPFMEGLLSLFTDTSLFTMLLRAPSIQTLVLGSPSGGNQPKTPSRNNFVWCSHFASTLLFLSFPPSLPPSYI